MRFAQFLGVLAACQGFGSRIGSQPDHKEKKMQGTFKKDAKVDLTDKNRNRLCEQCAKLAAEHVDRWFFYSWKIDDKRLIGQCEHTQPEEDTGFRTSSWMDKVDSNYCQTSTFLEIKDEEAAGVIGWTWNFLKITNDWIDILPDCKNCAGNNKIFFWKAEGQGSNRTFRTECDVKAPVDVGGWERSPPPPSGKDHFEITEDWCEKEFKDKRETTEAPLPEAPLQAPPNEEKDDPTGHRRNLFFWLKMLVALVFVVAAAAGLHRLYLARKDTATDDESKD